MKTTHTFLAALTVLMMTAQTGFGFQSGTFTRIEGKVEVTSSKNKTKKVSVGDKAVAGDTVKTAPMAKALLITPMGDQIYVGPATKMKLDNESSVQSSKVSLFYGKIRSMYSKSSGDRNMEVRAGNTSMGVRGTDFTVARDETLNSTDVTVVRGEVDVKSSKTALPTTVKSGETAQTKAGAAVSKLKASEAELSKVTDLTKITKPVAGAIPADKLNSVQGLEGKAANSSLADIKKYIPQFEPSKLGIAPGNLDQINEYAAKLAGGNLTNLIPKGLPGVPAAPAAPAAPSGDKIKDAGKNLLKGFGK